MINLIHGNDISASREKLSSLISGFNLETVFLDGKRLTLAEAVPAFESQSLFSDKKVIVIENFFQGRKSREKTILEDYIFKSSFFHEIILWENKKIERIRSLKLPPGLKTWAFDFEGNIFYFLDTLGRIKFPEIYRTFHSLLKSSEAELIYAMLVRQFRMLLLVSQGRLNNTGFPDWQYFKFKKQADYFKFDKLLLNYRKLLALDYQMKTGATPYNKTQLLDIFFTNL